MKRILWIVLLVPAVANYGAQTGGTASKFGAFDVATIKPVESDPKRGRMFRMDGLHRWIATDYTLKNLIALAYDLNPRAISGGLSWIESQHFDIEAITPGETKPTRMEQMTMLRALLSDRFDLRFHRVEKEFSIYELTTMKGGPKLQPTQKPDDSPQLIAVVYPGKVEVPAKNVTMDDFVAMLQRATLNRPVLNRTGLKGKYDFTLDWAPDETQYGGDLGRGPEDTPLPSLFNAMQEQLGLKLTATRGPVSTLVVDAAKQTVN